MNRFFLTTLIVCLAFVSTLSSQNVRIGVLSDYELSEDYVQLAEQLQREIQTVLGQSRKVVLPQDHLVASGRSLQEAALSYLALAETSDFIIAIGPISVKAAISNDELKVPTIGVGVIDPDIQDLPLTPEGTSGVKNFTYVFTSKDFETEISKFHEIAPFSNLTVLVQQVPAEIFNESKAIVQINKLETSLNATIRFIEMGENVGESLSGLNDETDAVYIAMPLTGSATYLEEISEILIQRKLPSFSANKWHVDHGIMGSISMDNARSQVLRKIAIIVDDVLNSQPMEAMNVHLNNKEELFLNLNTARKINFSPEFKHIFTANLVRGVTDASQIYSLDEIINSAIESNLDIKISEKDFELTEQDIKYAKSQFMPTLDVSATGIQVNEESTSRLTGQSETTLKGVGSLQQLIYSEEAIAGIKIQKHMHQAQKFALQQDVLGVLLDTYVAYFNVLSAKSYLAIQNENLTVSKKNLELAKIRVSLGSSSNADVYRWESEVANAMQTVVEANTAVMTRKLQLNTLLGHALKEEFDVEDVAIDSEVYNRFKKGELEQLTSNPGELATLSRFFVQEAMHNHPAKKQMLENIQAVERQHAMNKRMFYTPTVALQGQYSSIWHRGGVGSDPLPPDQSFGIDPSDNNWNVALSVSYPLFDGTRRKVKKQQSQIQLDQLESTRISLDQNLELGVRSNVYNLIGASTNTEFSRIAADNAAKNFELVQDSYKQGMVSIVNLIDAQQAALQSKLGYSISIYDFLIAHLQLEYSIGFFSLQMSPEEKQNIQQRFLEFASQNR